MFDVLDHLDWDIDTLLQLVDGHADEQLPAMSPSDWSLFAQGAATQSGLCRGHDDASALKWGTVAVWAYERCARALESVSKNQHDLHELSAMLIRVWAIQRFGAAAQDSIRDPAIFERWFLMLVPMSLEQWRATRPHRDPASPDEEMEWLRLEDRMRVLLPLLQQGIIRAESPISAWLQTLQPGSVSAA